jgi:hypothetical protein
MGSIQSNVELGTNSAFALGPRKTTENLDRVGRTNFVFWDTETRFVPHRRHITSPLQSPAF